MISSMYYFGKNFVDYFKMKGGTKLSELAICWYDYRVIREISKEEKKKKKIYIYIYVHPGMFSFLSSNAFILQYRVNFYFYNIKK